MTLFIAAAVAALAALIIFAATRPDTFRIERTTSIDAPPERVFALINDFRRWDAWSPYEKLDPAMKRSWSGAASGTGAVYAWQSDGKAGAGRMQITESAPPSKVTIRLDFEKPFETSNIVEFTLQRQGDGTHVTWAMNGPSPLVAKLMGVFLNMDRMIGTDFETGLANLSAIAQS